MPKSKIAVNIEPDGQYAFYGDITLQVKLSAAQIALNQFLKDAHIKQAEKPLTWNERFAVLQKITFITLSGFGAALGYHFFRLCGLVVNISNQEQYMILGSTWNGADTTATGQGMADAQEGYLSGNADADTQLFLGRANTTISGAIMGGFSAWAAVEVLTHGVKDMAAATVIGGGASIVGLAMFCSGASFVAAMAIAAVQANWEANAALRKAEDPSLLLENKIDDYYAWSKHLSIKFKELAELKKNRASSDRSWETKYWQHKISAKNKEIKLIYFRCKELREDVEALAEHPECKLNKVKGKYKFSGSVNSAQELVAALDEALIEPNKSDEPGINDSATPLLTLENRSASKDLEEQDRSSSSGSELSSQQKSTTQSLDINKIKRAIRADRLIIEQYKLAASKREDARAWTAATLGTGVGLLAAGPGGAWLMTAISSVFMGIASLYKSLQLKNLVLGRNKDNLSSDEELRDLLAITANEHDIDLSNVDSHDALIAKVKQVETEIIKKYLAAKNFDVENTYDQQIIDLNLDADTKAKIIDTYCCLNHTNSDNKLAYKQNNSLSRSAGKAISAGTEAVAARVNKLVTKLSFFGDASTKGREQVIKDIKPDRKI